MTPLTTDDVRRLAQLATDLGATCAPLGELLARLLRERGKLRVAARNLLCLLPEELGTEATVLHELVGPPT